MDMSMREKLDASDEFRKIGNCFYEEGQYQRAAYYFHRAIIHFEYMFPETNEKAEEGEMNPLKVKLLLNFAACRLKTQGYDEVINYCNQALALEPDHVKALYRIVQAHRFRDEYKEAEVVLSKALFLYPKDVNLRLEKEKLITTKMAYAMKSREMGKNMFFDHSAKKRTTSLASIQEKNILGHSMVNLKATPESSCESLEWWQPNDGGAMEMEMFLQEDNNYEGML